MKNTIYKGCLLVTILVMQACTLDYVNPNAASENQFNDKESLIALAIGIQQVYAVQAQDFATFVPAMTTREVSLILTNVANQEVERGGTGLLGTNLRMIELFSSLLRAKGMAELLIANVSSIEAQEGTKSGLLAWGKFYRALTLGALSQSWEQVPLVNSTTNDAEFVSRSQALDEAIGLLEDALSDLSSTPLSQEFVGILGQNIDLKNSIYAYLSRYRLMTGDYQGVIDASDEVDLMIKSEFVYDDQNQNPMFVGMLRQGELLFYAPREDFGLPSDLAPEAGDERISFYITDDASTSLTGQPVRNGTNAPFFSTATSSIPVFLPGEILLNIAEAHARLGQTADAVSAIDAVRTKTSSTDVYGLGANLAAYSGGTTESELLDEIYKNRRIELFLSGLSLEDSRRFGRSGPTPDGDFSTERSRNFYPYPSTERANNPNTPEDPDL